MKKITLIVFMLLFAVCGFAQLTPPEGFEAAWTADGPENWNVYQNSISTTQKWRQSNPLNDGVEFVHSGTYAAFVNQQNGPNGSVPPPQDWLVTPAFNLLANPILRFWSRLGFNGDDGGIYKILILDVTANPTADASLLSSYTEVISWTETTLQAAQQTYTEISVTTGFPAAMIGHQVRIAFFMEGDEADRWMIDDVSLESVCIPPSTQNVTDIDMDSAVLTWTQTGGIDEWEVEVRELAEPTTGEGVIVEGTPSYTIPNGDLEPNTDYKFYVRAVCSSSNTSAWVGPYNFSTVGPGDSCSAPLVITTLPYTHTDNTTNYADEYSGSPGSSCGSTSGYLNGNDVVYSYTPATDAVITINLLDLTDTYAGIFVYDDCADIGNNCIAGAVNGSETDDLEIPELSVTGGTTYYFVISTWASPDIVGYTLFIQQENCAKPTNLTATGATTTTINISWTEAGTATDWQYVVQPAGTGAPASGTDTAVTTISNVGPLTPATSYEVFVRSDCGDGTFSSWTGPLNFSTQCETFNLPFSEGFNSASTTELCWTVVNANGDTDTWDMNYTTNPFEGNQSAMMYTDGNGGNDNDWLISPTINLTGNQRLKFHYRVQSQFEPNAFEVLLSTSGIDVADFTLELIPLASYDNTTYVEAIVNLVDGTNTPISGPMNIAWHVPQGSPDGWRLYIDNVIIEEIPSCPDPTNLTAENVDEESAELTWNPGFNETDWEIVIQAPGTGAPTGAGTPTSNNPHPVSDLDPSTSYEYYVRAICDAGTNDVSNWVGPFVFMTTQIPADMDFNDDFEATTTEWSLINGSETNQWVVGSATSNGGTQSLYISNDSGTTNAYDNGEASVVHAFRDIQMPDTETAEINLSFDWKALAENCCDHLNVWIVPVSFNPTAGVEIDNGDGLQIASLNGNNAFITNNYVIPATDYTGQIIRLVFEWDNDGSLGDNPPGAVDNINLKVITCSAPTDLAASGITLNEATITWQAPAGAAPDGYDYYVSATNTAPNDTTVPTGSVDTETADLTDLLESTTYYVWVRSDCGDANGNSFWEGPIVFNTLCGAFDVPFFEGFNSDSTSQFCWTVLDENGDGEEWNMDYDFDSFEGDEVAIINTDFNNGNNDDWLISPTINLTGNQRLKFHYKVISDFEPNDFEVLLSTTGTDPEDFTVELVPLAQYSNEEYIEYIVNIENAGVLVSGPVNIAWHVPAGGLDGWILYIDNVIIEDVPPCVEPTNVELSCISSEGANVSWQPGDAETSWEIAIQPSNLPPPTSGTIVTETIYYAEDLNPVTDYCMYLRAICPNDEGVGAWVKQCFTTPLTSPIDANAFCASENLNATIIFDNVYDDMNVPEYGEVACLGSTPNPVWYYLQVDTPGDLNFLLVQNTDFDDITGAPLGMGLDVDFVAYGPFTSLNEACDQIELVDCPECPNNTWDPDFYPYTGTNIVDCSYDAAFTENFTIPDAQTGQIYAVMITNFNGAPGEIKLQQLPTSEGTTDCNIVYDVDLGDDIIVCGVENIELTAEVSTPGNAGAVTYTWSYNGDVFTPTIVSTDDLSQTISVTQSGTYTVEIEVENAANTEPIVDDIVVSIGPATTAVQPEDYEVCDDASNDGIALFDLTSLAEEALGTQNPDDFTVSYHLTENQATNNTSPIANPAEFINTTNPQTIYIRVTNNEVSECFAVVPAVLIVNPLPITTLDPLYEICEGDSVTITGIPQNYLETDATSFVWSKDGEVINGENAISITVSESGIYTLEVTLNGCTNTTDTEVDTLPDPSFSMGGPYEVCEPENAIIQITDPNNFDPATATYEWTFQGADVGGNTSSLQGIGFGEYFVTVTNELGCSSTQSIFIDEDTDAISMETTNGCEGNNYTLTVAPVDNSFDPSTADITWTGPEGFNSSGTTTVITVEGVYTVTVTTPEGCISQVSLPIESTSCLIPRGISPNGDTQNDSFDLRGFHVTKLSIFNRYGREVYSKSNYTNEWYGQTDGGEELPTGTYFYSMERSNGESQTGWVYINRQEN